MLMRYRGTGAISAADFKSSVKWVGRTKGGKAVTIRLFNAINMGALEWAYADKGEIVNEVVFTGSYTQAELDAGSTLEPFEIVTEDGVTAGDNEIILGAGKFYINDVAVGLSRGGGKFSRGAEIREITADNDRGTVKNRVVMDAARPTLSINALELLTRVADFYPAMSTAANDTIEIGRVDNVVMGTTATKTIALDVSVEGATITATVDGSGDDLAASVSEGVLTLASTSGTANDVYTVTLLATKTNYSAGTTAFTVTLSN